MLQGESKQRCLSKVVLLRMIEPIVILRAKKTNPKKLTKSFGRQTAGHFQSISDTKTFVPIVVFGSLAFQAIRWLMALHVHRPLRPGLCLQDA